MPHPFENLVDLTLLKHEVLLRRVQTSADAGQRREFILLLCARDDIVLECVLVLRQRVLVVLKLRRHNHEVTIDHGVPIETSSLAELRVETVVIDDRAAFFLLDWVQNGGGDDVNGLSLIPELLKSLRLGVGLLCMMISVLFHISPMREEHGTAIGVQVLPIKLIFAHLSINALETVVSVRWKLEMSELLWRNGPSFNFRDSNMPLLLIMKYSVLLRRYYHLVSGVRATSGGRGNTELVLGRSLIVRIPRRLGILILIVGE